MGKVLELSVLRLSAVDAAHLHSEMLIRAALDKLQADQGLMHRQSCFVQHSIYAGDCTTTDCTCSI